MRHQKRSFNSPSLHPWHSTCLPSLSKAPKSRPGGENKIKIASWPWKKMVCSITVVIDQQSVLNLCLNELLVMCYQSKSPIRGVAKWPLALPVRRANREARVSAQLGIIRPPAHYWQASSFTNPRCDSERWTNAMLVARNGGLKARRDRSCG